MFLTNDGDKNNQFSNSRILIAATLIKSEGPIHLYSILFHPKARDPESTLTTGAIYWCGALQSFMTMSRPSVGEFRDGLWRIIAFGCVPYYRKLLLMFWSVCTSGQYCSYPYRAPCGESYVINEMRVSDTQQSRPRRNGCENINPPAYDNLLVPQAGKRWEVVSLMIIWGTMISLNLASWREGKRNTSPRSQWGHVLQDISPLFWKTHSAAFDCRFAGEIRAGSISFELA